jgi:beta-mannosidase
MASFKALDGGLIELWVVNDTLAPVAVSARIELATLGSDTLSAAEINETVPAMSSRRIWRDRLAGKSDQVLHVRSAQFEGNRHFFAALKDIPFRPQALDMSIRQIDPHTLSVSLTALHYAYGALLLCPYAETGFSDNFVDLNAGESCSIIVSNPMIELRLNDVTLRHGLFEESAR